MKLLYVAAARTVWVFNLDLLNPKGLSVQPILDKLTEKYRFAKAPKNILDLDDQKALAFRLGTFINSKGTHVHVSLTIYNNGFVAETVSSTDDSTEFLQEISAWIAKDYGFVLPPDVKKGYLSQVHVECDVPLRNLSPKLMRFASLLSARVKTADKKPRQFDIGALQFWTEDMGQTMAPAMFRFERKWGEPFSSNQYFSQAALETQEHLDLLNELEQILKF